MTTRATIFTLVIGLVLPCVILLSEARADLVKQGMDKIPGHATGEVKWRAGYRKTPGTSAKAKKSVHFWYELELKNPQPGDDITFIVCAMININKPKINQDSWVVKKVSGKYECNKKATQTSFFPNYHFGCKSITFNDANGHKDNTTFDETVELSEEFTEDEMVAPYLDFIADCPFLANSCDDVFDKQNKFLTPLPDGGGINPDGTRSWWIVTSASAPLPAIVCRRPRSQPIATATESSPSFRKRVSFGIVV